MDQYKYIVSTPPPPELREGGGGLSNFGNLPKEGGGLEKYVRGGCDIFRKEVAAFP